MYYLGQSKRSLPCQNENYSLEVLTDQLEGVIAHEFGGRPPSDQERIILVGHSLGGAIAANYMARLKERQGDAVSDSALEKPVVIFKNPFILVLIDIVEGTTTIAVTVDVTPSYL